MGIGHTPDISVVTAVHCDRAEHIAETYASLTAQDSVTWEWVLQEDGTSPQLAETFPDPRVSHDALGGHYGVAATRNAALTRCRAPLVVVIDGDDCFAPEALATLTAPLADPGVVWTAGRAQPFGTESPRVRPETLAPGLVGAGNIAALLRAHGSVRPLSITMLCARTTHVRAVGGWAALAGGGEDKALLVALSELWPGVLVDEIVHLYRQWPGQMTRAADFEPTYQHRQDWILGRAAALHQLGTPSAP